MMGLLLGYHMFLGLWASTDLVLFHEADLMGP
jgi:hypothetical protein